MNIGSNIKQDQHVLITGARGRLGSLLVTHLNCRGIDRDDLDITDKLAVTKFFKNYTPDIFIHCAAYTHVSDAETSREDCFNINVEGTENLIKNFRGKRFIFISTDYVFDGERGNYREDDFPNPTNYYGLTKLFAELIVRQYKNSLIIRTSFKLDGPWAYPKAFIDQWTSADYVSERAPQIAQAALMNDLFGTIHIAGQRKSVYELAKEQTPTVGKMSIKDISTKLPKDVSLDSSLWKSILKTSVSKKASNKD